MDGFYGQYQTTMDTKGRIALPAKLRSVKGKAKKPVLQGGLIITQGMEGCLSVPYGVAGSKPQSELKWDIREASDHKGRRSDERYL